jgi:2,4-diaminopentanoate dehydrogenase
LTRPIRTVHWGTGAMGTRGLAAAAARPALEVAAVVSRRSARRAEEAIAAAAPELAGAIPADDDLTRAVERAGGADVVLLATDRHLSELEPQLLEAFDCGLSVVCIGEEALHPRRIDPVRARRIEERAIERGVGMVGTGANPGFLMDCLPAALTAPLRHWSHLRVRRASELSAYGDTVLRSMGIGLSVAEFDAELAAGRVEGHVGFELSLAVIGDALGVELAITEERCRPIVRDVTTELAGRSFGPGRVIGVDHSCQAASEDGRSVTLEHPQRLGRADDEPPMEDLVAIEGDPPVTLRIPGGLDGGAATVALMLNLVPAILAAEPGVHTVATLPLRAGIA